MEVTSTGSSFGEEMTLAFTRGTLLQGRCVDKSENDDDKRATIRLAGRFKIISCDSEDLTPRSSKGQGLLALLATEPEGERTRSWLQDRLWSDRGPEQGSRSLRQEILQIKKRFGPFAYIIGSGRKSVWLDLKTVQIIDDLDDVRSEFLEGIDVRDDEFNLWLTSQRARREPNILSAPAVTSFQHHQTTREDQTIAIVGCSAVDASSRVIEAQYLEAVSRSLRDLCDVTVYDTMPDSLDHSSLMISVQVFTLPDQVQCVRLAVETTDAAETVWSETLNTSVSGLVETGLDLRNLALINRLFSAVCQQLTRPEASRKVLLPSQLASLAIYKSFTIESSQLDEATGLLRQAYEHDKRGVFLGWQAQILTIKAVERFDKMDGANADLGSELCAEAIRLDPTNSNVLASVANYKTIVERNEVSGIELARLAVRANPANPLAWWALSNAVQYTGDTQHAYLAASRAFELSKGTKIEFWSAFQRSLAAMLDGKLDEGRRFGELSNALQPGFRPPLRYLAALYSKVEDAHNGMRVLSNLAKNEKDFSIDRFVNDEDYPVRIMRDHSLLNDEWLQQFNDQIE